MTGKPKFSEEYEEKAVEYRRYNTEADTAEKFGVSPSTIRYWLSKRGIRVSRARYLAADEEPQVRILKRVPEGFRVPHRRFGW